MHKVINLLFILAITVFFGTCMKYVFAIYSADLQAERASNFFSDGDFEAAFRFSSKAIKLNPREPRYYTGRAKSYLALSAGGDASEARTYKLLALEDLRTAMELNPNNIITVKSIISLYFFLALKDLSLPSGPNNIDSDFADINIAFYKSIWNKSPNDVGIFVLIHTYSKRLGFEDITEASRQKIMELRPDLLDWYDFN